MIYRPAAIWSGGQTGADQGGLRGARACGIPTGGMVPRGCKTEDGPAPWLVTDYGCIESRFEDYGRRTRYNVRSTDGTVIIAKLKDSDWIVDGIDEPGPVAEGGSALTKLYCIRLNKPCLIIGYSNGRLHNDHRWLREWASINQIGILNVAGNRESVSPGIGSATEQLILDAFGGGGA